MTYQRFEEIINKLSDLFIVEHTNNNESSLQIEAFNGVRLGYIKDLMHQRTLSKDDIKILNKFFKSKSNCCQSWTNPLDGIVFTANDVREKTHGACFLFKAFVAENVYNSILENSGLDKNSVYKIRSAPILQCNLVSDNWIILLFNSKFSQIDPENMVFFIQMETNGNN